MKYEIIVDIIPFNYWYSNNKYKAGDWIQFVTPKWKSFPYKIGSIVRYWNNEESNCKYKYKLV